jgi:flagellar hook-associated protein 1 FlgK
MASVSNMKLAGLSGTNPLDYYLQMAFNLGQEIVSREARLEGREGVMQQLRDQREKISGVDLNDEAAQLIIFERMYQAASKVISTQNQVLQYLFNII